MERRVVDLGTEVGLIWSKNFPGKLVGQRERHPLLPGLEGIGHDLWAAGPQNLVPARLERGREGRDDFLKVYVDGRYALMLFPTRDLRGYWVGGIHPMRFDDHDQIVRGGLLLRAGRWRVYDHPRELGHSSGWPAVQAAWSAGGPAPAATAAPRASHTTYLDRLETVVEQGRRIEASGGDASRLIPYLRVTPVAATRRSARSVHAFQLIGGNRLTDGSRVHIDGEPDLRGRVERVDEGVATVRFERPVDFGRIPESGAFAESPNLVSYDKKREAIEILREGRARNPLLLTVLADGRFQPFAPALGRRPREPLDASQLSAFQKALAVPDLGLVQGPPGTGKTHTIRQVVLACAEEQRKVLISSYTNRAVDNVLQGLPEDLLVLRVGREDGVTRGCEHLTLEARALELQQRIAERTEPLLARYGAAAPDGPADALLRQLGEDLRRLDEARAVVRRSAAAMAEREEAVTVEIRRRTASLEEAGRRHEELLADSVRSLHRLGRAVDRARRSAGLPLVGLLFRGRLDRLERERAAIGAEAGKARRTLEAIARDLAHVAAELDQVRATHPDLVAARRAHERELAEQHARAERAARVAASLSELLDGGLPAPSPDPAGLAAFSSAAAAALALMRRRLHLLNSWRAKLERRTEQLYAELVRYADVIGATCIGAATSEHLDDVDLDLAIVDEAGQISTADLLVPLVRARRAVLVGDHVQLPPLPDQRLVAWAAAERPGDHELARLITDSAFELMFSLTPPENKEVLRYQRRMPESLARFISAHFYGGFLLSDVRRVHHDDLFAAPVAFVDTAELPQRERRDRKPRPDEPWPKDSRLNECEARLLTLLAAHYHAKSDDWAVILPYAAQIGLVTSLLARRIGDENAVARRVATVDSFQGGQHDTILFGFTLSNPQRSVGFLREVRRSNVAFSRAKQRLVLVGDLSTLLNATDPGFRGLAQALHDHVRISGDLRGYREVLRHLGEAP
ncbi:AAA domain-containing protein [Actinomadura sp. ATCC 31491]|uniref:AAA domain-containing protein n=1 Tax=Actinomadura luzonensis TaxID=2805427 RepID=A0ABT0FN81_9ACTN|nr:AAA domain-containing protein [Actinomadura luzonensis]MCK2213757.1 AAA domain-containing protein [Actinomadura luzonensis]